MKKIFLLSALIIPATLFFYSCKTGPAYTIKMRLNKGDTFVQDITMSMQVNAATVETATNFIASSDFVVLNNDSLNKQLKMTYRKVHSSVEMGKLNAVKHLSDSMTNKRDSILLGKSVILTLSKENEILNVSGYDDIMNSMMADSAGKAMMKKMLSKDQIVNTFGMMFSMYPKTSVRVGDTWNSDTKTNIAGMDMKISIKYKLLSVKNGYAEIGIDGTIGGGGELMKQNSGVKIDMDGTQKGTVSIRMDNGYLHSSSYKSDVKANMQMMGQKFPMSMKIQYTIKGI